MEHYLYCCLRIPKSLSFIVILIALYQAQETTRIDIGGRWQLECPRVGYRAAQDRLSVTWTQNNAIWLKIERSNASIAQQLESLQTSRMGSSTILNIASNNFRYKFYYDEMIGTYELTITGAAPEDSGHWVCYVTLERAQDDTQDEFTSEEFLIVGTVTTSVMTDYKDPSDNEDDDTVETNDNQRPTQQSGMAKPSRQIGSTPPWNTTANSTAVAIPNDPSTSFRIVLSLLTVLTVGRA